MTSIKHSWIFIVAAAGLMTVVAAASFASTKVVTVEPQSSALQVAESNAAGGEYVRFQASQIGGDGRIPIIFDCDCANEVDDQFALAYALVRDDIFDVRGVTANGSGRVTSGSLGVERHRQEAQFVVDLVYGPGSGMPVISGANNGDLYTGPNNAAADFIAEEARKYSPDNKLVIVTVGGVANAAMALERNPEIADNVKVFSLLGNYPLNPDPEHNASRDPGGTNKLLQGPAEFEMFSNNFSKRGASKITLNRGQVDTNIKGTGPQLDAPVISPYGPGFTNIGDFLSYLANRFFPSGERPMYDTAPIAIMLDDGLGIGREVAAPEYRGGAVAQRGWLAAPNSNRTIVYWEDFDLEGIRQSMYASFVLDDSKPTFQP